MDRRYEVRDLLLPGFGIRVSVGGKKTWFAVGRVDGRQVRHTIGSYPTVTLGEAREAARLILKDIQLGLYAPAKPDPEAAPPTLNEMITLFIEIYAKPKNRGWKAVQATFRKFSSLNDRPIAEITRAGSMALPPKGLRLLPIARCQPSRSYSLGPSTAAQLRSIRWSGFKSLELNARATGC